MAQSVMIDLQTCLDGLFLVIITLDQVFAGLIILAFHLGWVVDDVIGTTGFQVDTASGHPLDDFFIRDIDFNFGIDCYTGFF